MSKHFSSSLILHPFPSPFSLCGSAAQVSEANGRAASWSVLRAVLCSWFLVLRFWFFCGLCVLLRQEDWREFEVLLGLRPATSTLRSVGGRWADLLERRIGVHAEARRRREAETGDGEQRAEALRQAQGRPEFTWASPCDIFALLRRRLEGGRDKRVPPRGFEPSSFLIHPPSFQKGPTLPPLVVLRKDERLWWGVLDWRETGGMEASGVQSGH